MVVHLVPARILAVIFIAVFDINFFLVVSLNAKESFSTRFNDSAVMETSSSAACVNVFIALNCSSALVLSVVFLSSIILILSERGVVLMGSSGMVFMLLECVIVVVDVIWSKAKVFLGFFPYCRFLDEWMCWAYQSWCCC